MQEKIWAPHEVRAIKYTALKSSHDRFWTGFEATLYAASSGINEDVFVDHTISMHVGAPVHVGSRCDGTIARHLQVPGDLKIVPAGMVRIWETEAPTHKLVVDLTAALVRTAAMEMGVDPDRVSIVAQVHLRDPLVEHIGWALLAELETKEPWGRLYADSLGLALAAQLLRRYGPVVPHRLGNSLPRRRLQRVLDYVHDHLGDDLALTELAGIAHLSPSHFKVLFKQAVGVPVHQYVIRSRVEFAIELLRRGKLAASDVALQAGFASQSHMARCMRRVAGVTPGAVPRAGL